MRYPFTGDEKPEGLNATLSRWSISIRVFLVWLLLAVLALAIVVLWHDLLAVFIANTLRWNNNIVRLIRILYYYAAGLSFVVYFFAIKEYLNRAVPKGILLARSLRTVGIQALIIALSQAALTLYGYYPISWVGITLIGAEGLVGGVMIFLAWIAKGRKLKASAQAQG